MDARKRDKFKTSLEEERDRLATEVAEMEEASAENLSDVSGENNYRDHMADQGTATFTRELDMTLFDNTRQLLEQVDKALARVEEGSYGTCTRCSKKISIPRLEAVPSAELCIECKEWEEQV